MKTARIKVKFLTILSIAAITFLSCHNNTYKEKELLERVDVDASYKAIDVELESENHKTIKSVSKELKLIKTAQIRYKVINIKESLQKIKNTAKYYQSYISDLRFDNNLHIKENRFTLKVPKQHFDVVMDSIKHVAAFIEYEHITTHDVTEEYIDINTRLQTKLDVRDRYKEILQKNAKTVKDILTTEDKLRIIQEEIESAQGRLNYLTNSVAYSSIQIDLCETVEYKEEPKRYHKSFWSKATKGFSFGWQIIKSILLGLIHIWPILILGILLFFFIRHKMEKKKTKH